LALLSLYLGVPLLATWWGATQRPIFNERYLVAAVPPFYLLLVAPFARWFQPMATSQSALKRTGLAVLMIVALMGMGFSLNRAYGDPAYSKTRGWRALAMTLTQLSAGLPPDEVRIAQNFPDPTLWYYYTGPVTHIVLPPAPQDEAGADTAVQDLYNADVKRILLPLQPARNWDDQGIAAATLGAAYSLVWEQPIGVWPVQLYVAPPTALTPVDVSFDNGITLVNFAMQPTMLTPANVLVVHLGWQRDADSSARSLTGSEKVFVQLLDPAGQLIAQDDRPLDVYTIQPAMTTLTTYGILLPETLPIGDNTLIAGLYDPALVGAPRMLTMEGADHVTLKTLTVEPWGN
jgi:hypothetical protein